jgi:hypothetical protein
LRPIRVRDASRIDRYHRRADHELPAT